ncbi:MAG TPA: hypothetical protein VKZ60_16345 [Chloroflexota bacterium]|nr:hypothetical protein [Chloroflexota bacterium]
MAHDEPYAHLFDGVAAREVRLRLLEETYQQARALIDAQGWAEAWGEDAFLIIFAHGLAHLRAELAREHDQGQGPADEMARLRAAWMAAEAQYAVMKFRAYTLTEENRRLRWSLTAAERQRALAEQRLTQLRGEVRALKEELAAGPAVASAVPAPAPAALSPATASPPAPLGTRLRQLWRRWTTWVAG